MSWFVTHTGRRVDLERPDEAEIVIDDVAHALAHTCRFGGHVSRFYSVAEHSIAVSYIVPVEDALDGLLHDATEAYLGDVIRPLKALLPAYKLLEQRWADAIARQLGCSAVMPASVKDADRIMLATERRDVHPAAYEARGRWRFVEDELAVEPRTRPVDAYPPTYAKELFLLRWEQLRPRVSE